jgi:hypothetical protein
METEVYGQLLSDSKKIELEPLKQWYCDHCGEIIDCADNGWLEWLKEIDGDREDKFRIVHHDEKCMYNDKNLFRQGYLTRDMHLNHYVGPDGLNNLLEIMTRPGMDQAEVIKIIRRIHVPYYEQSLLYREVAISEGYFSSDPEFYCNVQDNLDLINRYAEKE